MKKKRRDIDSESRGNRGFYLKIALAIFSLVLILYGNSLKNGYSLDDEYVIYNNATVQQGIKAIPEIFTSRYATEGESAYGYRPLAKAVFAIEHQLFGNKPAISHFVNLVIYAATGFLLFVLFRRLLKNYHWSFSFLVVALFIAHPLHTEVVNSLKNRDELLSFLLVLLAFRYILRYVEKQSIASLAAGGLMMTLSLLAKPSSLTFIALIPLALFYFTNATKKQLILAAGVLAGALGIMKLMSLLLLDEAGTRMFVYVENPLFFEGDLLMKIKAAVISLFFYVKMLFFAHPLVSYYGYNQVSFDDWDDPFVLLVAIAALALGAWALFRIRKKEVWTFGVLYVLVAISMYLNVVVPVVGIVGERFAYVASLGFCMLLVFIFYRLAGAAAEKNVFRHVNIKWLPLAAVIILFSIQTIARNPDWKDHYTLYSADVKKAPDSAKLHALLAAKASFDIKYDNGNINRNKLEEAIAHYREAIRIYPSYITSLNNLGMLLYTYKKDAAGAVELWKKAVSVDTNYADGYFNLATAENALQRYDEAERHYQKVIDLKPGFTKVYTDLGLMYAQRQEYDKVLAMSKAALDKNIVSDVLYINIGNVMLVRGDTLAAVENFEKAVSVNGMNPALCCFLSGHYSRTDNTEKAGYYSACCSP